jgi:hypothetical protein
MFSLQQRIQDDSSPCVEQTHSELDVFDGWTAEGLLIEAASSEERVATHGP